MTQATNTVLGEIKLAGDLAGSTDANAPELTATGITPGVYPFPTVTFDSKGRATACSIGTSAHLTDLIPEATPTVKGIVKIGQNIEYTTNQTVGSLTCNFNGVLTGGSATGLCSTGPDFTFKILIDSTNQKNVTIPTGSFTTITGLLAFVNPLISPAVIELVSGNLRIKSNTVGTGSTIRLISDNFFKYMANYVAWQTPWDGMGDTTIYLNEASSTVKGVCKLGSGFLVNPNDGTASFDTSSITSATTGTRGIVQIGAGISVSNGLISTTALPDASSGNKGIVQIGSNINVSSGTISIPAATGSIAGVFKVGNGLQSIDGVLQLDSTMFATSTTPGLVKIGSGLNVSGGVLSAGSVIATASNLGMVKIGTGIAVTGDGTISVAPGSIPDATATTKGLVQIGSNIQVSGGVISLPLGTGTVPGICKINTAVGLSVSGGVISAVLANGTSTLGVVRVNDTNNLTANAGVLDVGPNIPKLNTANTYTKAQVVALSTPAFTNAMTLDFSQSNTFSFIANSDFTLANPANVVAGGVYYIIVKQDATGNRAITWGSNFKFRGVTPSLSSEANATDIITVVATGTTFLAAEVYKGY
jgi:hypothetical protein